MLASVRWCTLRLSGRVTDWTRGHHLLVAFYSNDSTKENIMTWTTPTAVNFRYGFEITLYIANR